MDQAHQTKLRNQPWGGIPVPPHVPPALGEERVEALLDPPIELMKESAPLRFAREGPPAPDHGIPSGSLIAAVKTPIYCGDAVAIRI